MLSYEVLESHSSQVPYKAVPATGIRELKLGQII